ncbi:MAG: putative integral rane protein [Microbacterium sp.]|jgi:hypothetical protein|nr:putative integral rane protein [Microbacterium sp.]
MTASRSAGTGPVLSARTRTITFVLIGAVVVSSFLGRYDLPVAGFRVRIEQVVPLILVVWMLAHPVLRRAFLRAVRHPVPLVYAAFVAWNVVSTLVFSPSLVWSASILVWLTIDLLLLVSLMAVTEGANLAERLGRASVVPWGLVGFAAFAVANLTRGRIDVGADFDYLYEVYVARATAIEANIYASILVFWTLLAITRRGIGRVETAAIAIAVPLGLIASQTRTAVFSLLLGLVVFAVYALVTDHRPARQRWTRVLPAAIVAGTIVVSYGIMAAAGGTEPADRTLSASASPSPGATREPDPTNPEQQNKIGDIDFEGGTIGFRLTVAELAAEDMTGVNLWFGNGTNTFGIRHEQPGTPGVSGHIIMLPVQVLYDGGIVGLGLLAAFFVTVFACVPRRRRPVAAGLLAAYLLSATLTSMFWFAVTWILVAVLVRSESPAERDLDDA